MKNIKIAFFDAKPYDRESFEKMNARYGFQIRYIENHLNEDTAIFAKGYDVVCAFVNDSLSEKVINQIVDGGTRLAALRCAGYNNVDLKASFGKLHVVRVPAYSPYAVAEHALALIMALNRKTHKAYARTRENNFSIAGLVGFDMYGKTAGVIGTGRIGKVLISILKGLGMNVLAHDHFPDFKAAGEMGYSYVELDELYRQSDILSLHCPLTKETEHMINAESIARMKPGVMIINTGRGQLIDSRALIEGLKQRTIGAAGLDVYEEEGDYFFEDFSTKGLDDDVLARLLTFPNVIITSHQAFFTHEALANISQTTFENIRLFFDKNELPNEICYRCQTGSCPKNSGGKCF